LRLLGLGYFLINIQHNTKLRKPHGLTRNRRCCMWEILLVIQK